MTELARLLLIPLIAGLFGVVAAFFTDRAPMSGRVALALLIAPFLSVLSVGLDSDSKLIGIIAWTVFAFSVPISLTYSFHARRRAPDRRLALAGLAGAVLFSLAYLLMMPQLAFFVVREMLGADGSR